MGLEIGIVSRGKLFYVCTAAAACGICGMKTQDSVTEIFSHALFLTADEGTVSVYYQILTQCRASMSCSTVRVIVRVNFAYGSCSLQSTKTHIAKIHLTIIVQLSLVRHTWREHGTCTRKDSVCQSQSSSRRWTVAPFPVLYKRTRPETGRS